MKIRTGFVSNSSSSSFVCIGLKIPKDELSDELRELADKKRYTIFNDDEDGYRNDTHAIIGNIIAEGNDYDFDEDEYSLSDIKKIEQDISDDLDVDGEIVMITGTRMC